MEGDSSKSAPSDWGQSNMMKIVSSGWGQPSNIGDLDRRRFELGWGQISQTHPSIHTPQIENYEGPVESWTNYMQITPEDWELYQKHQIVYTDGKNVEGVEAGWLFCQMCNKKTSTRDLMQSHMEGAKHKRSFEWLLNQRDGSLQVGEEMKQNSCNYLVLTEEESRIVTEHRGEVDPSGWIVCTLCDKKLMDMSFFADHISSRKHLNYLEWARNNDDRDKDLPEYIVASEWGYRCTVCDVPMNSKSVIGIHLASSRHSRNLGYNHRKDWGEVDFQPRRGVPLADLIEFEPEGSLSQSNAVRDALSPPSSFSERHRYPSPPRHAPAAVNRWEINEKDVYGIPSLIDI